MELHECLTQDDLLAGASLHEENLREANELMNAETETVHRLTIENYSLAAVQNRLGMSIRKAARNG